MSKGILENRHIIKSLRLFYKDIDYYIRKFPSRSNQKNFHVNVIKLAGDRYEDYQAHFARCGNELLERASPIFLDVQDAVERRDIDKLKVICQQLDSLISEEEKKEKWTEAFREVAKNDIEQMNLQQEKRELCQNLVDADIKLNGEVSDKTKEVLAVYNVELINGKVYEKVQERAHSPEEKFYSSKLNNMEDFLKRHYAKLKVLKETSEKKTLVVNAYAGPGAGKTTACLATVAELKKKGYVAEYIPEYAKELVYDNPALLDGSKENQLHILEQQLKRLDRFLGKADIIVTDASILLNPVYLAEPDPDYEQAIGKLYKQYENFNFFVKRGEDYVQEGRMENQEESIQKDQQIKDILKKNNIFYGNFNHQTVDKLAEKIEFTYKRIMQENKERAENGGKNQQAPYQARVYLKQKTDTPTFLFGNSPENIIAQLQEENKGLAEGMQFYSAYISKLDPETNRYENPAKYEVASGKDITPIYLNLPHMEREEFKKVAEQLRADGAKYNFVKKAFYTTKDNLNPFAAYLPIAGTHAAAGENRSKHELNYFLILNRESNKAEIKVEGKKPFWIRGEKYSIDFSTLSEEKARELIEKFVLPEKELEEEESVREEPKHGSRVKAWDNKLRETHKSSKSPQIEQKEIKGNKDSVCGKLEVNKGKIEATNQESAMLEKVANEHSR